jgi:hypothetical protein
MSGSGPEGGVSQPLHLQQTGGCTARPPVQQPFSTLPCQAALLSCPAQGPALLITALPCPALLPADRHCSMRRQAWRAGLPPVEPRHLA